MLTLSLSAFIMYRWSVHMHWLTRLLVRSLLHTHTQALDRGYKMILIILHQAADSNKEGNTIRNEGGF